MFNYHQLVAATLVVVAAPAAAVLPQPQFQTPAAAIPVNPAVYVVPYATHAGTTTGSPVRTVVTVGNSEAQPSCDVQLEWINFNNAGAGVSGPFAVGPGETFEFTTTVLGAPAPWPFFENVHRNATADFEGHAKIRTTCPAPGKLRVNAQTVSTNKSGLLEYMHVKVVRVPGNAGD